MTSILYVILITSGAMATVTTTSQTPMTTIKCNKAKDSLNELEIPTLSITALCLGN